MDNSEQIVKGVLYFTIGLSVFSVLFCGSTTWLVAFIYVKTAGMDLDVLNFCCETDLVKWERFALMWALFVGGVALSCSGSKSSVKCGGMNLNEKAAKKKEEPKKNNNKGN